MGVKSGIIEKKKLNSDENVPMLTFGAGTNFAVFQEALSVACLEKYGDLGRLIEDDEYHVPPFVKKEDHLPPEEDFDDPDIQAIYQQGYAESVKQRIKDIAKMKSQRSSLYAYIRSKLSVESENEVKRHNDFENFSKEVCPLGLWRAVKATHLVTTTSRDSRMIKYNAAQEYGKLRQGAFQSLIDFKRQYDLKYKAYVTLGNDAKDETDQAINFLNALDRSRYGEFVVEYLNGISFGSIEAPKNVEEVYDLANTRLQVKRATKTEGASYSIIDHAPKPQRNKGKSKDNKKGKGDKKGHKSQEKVPRVTSRKEKLRVMMPVTMAPRVKAKARIPE